MSKTTLDHTQINRMKFDEELKADRVTLVASDINIELSHLDGDSVITKVRTEAIAVKPDQIIDLSSCTKVCAAGEDVNAVIFIDGVELTPITFYAGVVKDICLTTIKIKAGQDSYLLVQ